MASICAERKQSLAALFHKNIMKAQGFKKYGETWNRTMSEGIVHVLNFQNSLYNIKATCHMTVNIAVYLPLLNLQNDHYKSIKEPACHFRQRLNMLATGLDTWFYLTDDHHQLIQDLTALYHQYAINWFKQYESYEAILAWWHSLDESNHYASHLFYMSRLFAELGDKEQAKQLYIAQIERSPYNHFQILNDARKYGIDLDLPTQE